MGENPSPPPRSGEPQLTHHEPHPTQAQVVGGHVAKHATVLHDEFSGPQQHPAAAANIASSPQSAYHQQAPFDMAAVANSLPSPGYRPHQFPQGGHRYMATTSPQMVPQMPQMPSYGGPSPMAMNQGYYVPQPQMPPYYAGSHMPPPGPPPMQPRHNVAYYPNRAMMNHPQSAYYYGHATPFPNQPPGMPVGMMPGHYAAGNSPSPEYRKHRASIDGLGVMPQVPRQGQEDADNRQSAVRGPPRKPRQSGHAIWIGNLPPQTDLMSLVHHVCRETPGLESLFLISKSNCAFANFKDEETCVAAQQKLHDSKFQSVRLVSRLRKRTVEGATGLTAPTGPAASTVGATAQGEAAQEPVAPGSPSQSLAVPQPAHPTAGPASEINVQQDKFFILKSLTLEDLELSVRTGIWATQSHNEESLNNAYKTSDHVYLIFSANKSGEYFGYARMTSEINEDPEAAIEFAPKAQATSSLGLPKAIITEATEFAPRGRIIDDSSRGTIFWEAEREDTEGEGDSDSEAGSTKSADTDEEARTWGKPFKLEWLSMFRLPFYRTRGLRNPWNSNREVKIARDGTELEPSVGRRLIGLFNRGQGPGPMPQGMRPAMAMMQGMPPGRAYGP